MRSELRLWLADKITQLAEACGEELTAARLRIYTEALSDLSREQLQIALNWAIRELRFFPKIAELRDLAGAKAQDAQQVEANAAWEAANRYLQRYGVVKYDRDFRPALDPRIDYVLRRIGGLWGLNQVTTESYPFKYKEFCEAYQLAPMANLMALRLEEKFAVKQLVGEVQPKLSGGTTQQKCETQPQPIKKFPEPLTEAQVKDRREMLRQQTEALQRGSK
jgi:hypothetical protein